MPRSVVQRFAAPYIAGESLDDARRVVAELNASGKLATIDVLGEEITRAEEAVAIATEYRAVLDAIARHGLRSSVSIKLTALGLKLDTALCTALVGDLVSEAARRGTFVRIDMEDASCTDETLALYRDLRAQSLDNVGIVLQACLRRTLADIAELAELQPRVRLCKGIYIEPAAIAFRDPDVIRRSYLAAFDALLACGCHVAAATHDEALLREVIARAATIGPDGYELQMLLGVRERRANELAAGGHPVRIYVPYGRRWYEYSLRRLQENPAVAGHVAGDALRRLTGRGAAP
jgi:proline dehydrogenase